jgi:hypothetical protein
MERRLSVRLHHLGFVFQHFADRWRSLDRFQPIVWVHRDPRLPVNPDRLFHDAHQVRLRVDWVDRVRASRYSSAMWARLRGCVGATRCGTFPMGRRGGSTGIRDRAGADVTLVTDVVRELLRDRDVPSVGRGR